MKTILVGATLLCVLLINQIALAQDAERIALVIGNSDYPHEPLNNPRNDARDIAAALEQLNFSVTLQEDLDKRQMITAISTFTEQLSRGSAIGLFYYAGHGVGVNGINYMLPLGVQLRQEAEVEFEAVAINRLLVQMQQARNALNIIIIDACRNNPFGLGFSRSSPTRGLSRINAPVGSIIASSTAPGAVAEDGAYGRNSPYTKHLLHAIRQPGLSIESIFKQVRKGVLADTDGRQVPWEASSLLSDFYFIEPSVSSVSEPPPEPKLASAVSPTPPAPAPAPPPENKPIQTDDTPTVTLSEYVELVERFKNNGAPPALYDELMSVFQTVESINRSRLYDSEQRALRFGDEAKKHYVDEQKRKFFALKVAHTAFGKTNSDKLVKELAKRYNEVVQFDISDLDLDQKYLRDDVAKTLENNTELLNSNSESKGIY